MVSSGFSFEGNAITGIHLYGSGGKGRRPAVVFHGTVHAREWIASKVRKRARWSLGGTHLLTVGAAWAW